MPTIMRKVNMLSRCEGLYRTDHLRQEDLRGYHHSYILSICGNPGISQEELARYICTNKSTVTRHVTQLEENGYVERRPSESDRRVMRVYPTERMQALLPAVRRITEEWDRYLTEGLSEAEIAGFYRILERIAERATHYLDEREKAVQCE